jgi:hypothetical protein
LPEKHPRKLSDVAGGILGTDQAMAIECQNIYKHLGMNPGPFIDGYALLYSLSELDVVSVHTAGHSEVETVNTERVPMRPIYYSDNERAGAKDDATIRRSSCPAGTN